MWLFCAQITDWRRHSEHGHPALRWTAQGHEPVHLDVERRGSWIPGASDPVSGGYRDKSCDGKSCHLVSLSSAGTRLEQRDAYRPLSASQACKHTLAICALELKWSTFPQFMEHYSFEMVVLNICNNIVSGPLVFPTTHFRKNRKGSPKRWKGVGDKGESWGRKAKKNGW